ncbi:MAG: cytochrome c class I [Pseudomonadota bacterium]
MPGASRQRIARGGGIALLIALGCGAVAVWALAPPGRDPLGQAIGWADAQLIRLHDWYRTQPVDGVPEWDAAQLQLLQGDPAQGPALMVAYGCGSCHAIPGVAAAHGSVGPSLARFGDRAYIAGILPNTPGNLTNWLINPPLYAEATAMPDMGVTEGHAKDMAAYLLALGHDR